MGARSRDRGAPARVFFFPKRELGRRGTPFEFASPVLRTLPELAAVDPDAELVTEPVFVSPFAEAKKSGGRAPSASGRTRTRELPVDPDEAITEDIPAGVRQALPYAGLSRREIAEVSLFGHGLFEAGRIEEARQVFEQLVAAGAQDAFPHTMLGTIYLAQRDPERALALFETALSIDPRDLAARVYRGEIRLNRGETKQAVADLERARTDGPKGDPFTERARRLLKVADEGRRKRR